MPVAQLSAVDGDTLDVEDRDAQYGAVRRDEGKVDAQGRVKGRGDLLDDHFHELHEGRDDEDEDQRHEVPEVERFNALPVSKDLVEKIAFGRIEEEVVNEPADHARQRHDEDNGEAHAERRLLLRGHADVRAVAQKAREDEVVDENN